MKKSLHFAFFAFIVGLIFTAKTGFKQDYKADLAAVKQKAIEYLKVRGQNSEGAFSPKIGIGVTALAATALMENGVSNADPAVRKAVAIVAKSAREDGGIYADDSRLKMYETCVSIVCLKRLTTKASTMNY